MGKKNIPYIEETYDVVVVGAGHAGCEAALACARLGLETMMFTVSVDSIALMPCNPNIGGSSKGHLVRGIDALGEEMGKNIDKTFIQSKMLNKSKGPAVHSLRAQADKAEYTKEMRKTLQNTDHLSIRQAEVAEILTNKDQFFPEDEYHEGEEQKITGVRTVSGGVYRCKAVVLCTGTYLRARCLTGEMITHTGPNGLSAANHLTDSLVAHGIQTRRFKTGTPARVDKRSLDFSKMEDGKYDIADAGFTVSIASLFGKEKSEAAIETHKKFIDIQFPLLGVERIGWKPGDQLLEESVPYNEEQDIAFYIDKPTAYTKSYPGQFAIYFPEDGHAPGIGQGNIRKVVIKIPVQ